MDEIKRFIECVMPVTVCNLRCSYCYVIQRNANKQELPKMKYDSQRISSALTKERFGGVCYFNICGSGETLIPHETLEIVYEILNQGHYVNITTNGTLTHRFNELKEFPRDFLERLSISFSFHYLELKRINMLTSFFENLKLVKSLGASYVLQLNMCDEYIPYIDEIKDISMQNTGAYPQVALTRRENRVNNNIEVLTNDIEQYMSAAQSFDSPLFEFTRKQFNVKRGEFCYAGDWSFQLNLANGTLRRCYCSNIEQNIFKNVEKPIKFMAMGYACVEKYCINSSHFMALGIIPAVHTPSYADLRNRKEAGWYNDRLNNFLQTRLYTSNKIYDSQQVKISQIYKAKEVFLEGISRIKSVVKKVINFSGSKLNCM